jgi:pimeloyl-ACP methyl ester carboxylesterase
MERVRVGGVMLAYDVRGEGPPLVLLHGLGERASSWDSVRDALAARFTTYALDVRGHGASDWSGPYSHDEIEADVIGWHDLLGLRDAVLVGHSMGGSVALRIAAHRPDLVSRLVVEDVIPPFPRSRAVPERPARELDFDWSAVPALMTEASTYDEPAWAELCQVVAPTLVVSGGSRSHLPADLVDDVVRRVASCSLVTIDAGHHVHRHEPAAFVGAVLAWLA